MVLERPRQYIVFDIQLALSSGIAWCWNVSSRLASRRLRMPTAPSRPQASSSCTRPCLLPGSASNVGVPRQQWPARTHIARMVVCNETLLMLRTSLKPTKTSGSTDISQRGSRTAREQSYFDNVRHEEEKCAGSMYILAGQMRQEDGDDHVAKRTGSMHNLTEKTIADALRPSHVLSCRLLVKRKTSRNSTRSKLQPTIVALSRFDPD